MLEDGEVERAGLVEVTEGIYHHTKLKYRLEITGRGERSEIRTPCKVGKMAMSPSHKPGKARSLSHWFLENKIL